MPRNHVAAVTAILCASLAVVALWLSQPDPPPCVTYPDGMRACMPIIVVPPPWWAYVVVAALGAAVGGGFAVTVTRWVDRFG